MTQGVGLLQLRGSPIFMLYGELLNGVLRMWVGCLLHLQFFLITFVEPKVFRQTYY